VKRLTSARWHRRAGALVAAVVLTACGGASTMKAASTTKTDSTPAQETSPPTTETVLAPGQVDRDHPSSRLTPGDVFVDATVDVICEPGYAKSVRAVDDHLRDSVFSAYGVANQDRKSYQLDHLVPLELGGSNDARNLWPQPISSTSEVDAHDKDVLENQLHAVVCSGHADLASAQAAIVHWDTASLPLPPPAPTTTTEPPTTLPPTTLPPVTLPPVTEPPTTLPPVTEPPVTVPPVAAAPAPDCEPGYDPCIPPGPDVDCAGGSGNGPRYVNGPVSVTGSDPYGLDSNHDGVGCES
jgi:hypothetical protein